jgi:Tol biopolymer transport system component
MMNQIRAWFTYAMNHWPIALPLGLFCVFLMGVFMNSLKGIPSCSQTPDRQRAITFTVVNTLYAMHSDGTSICRLMPIDTSLEDVSWSPTGSRIAYMAVKDKNAEIYSMNVDGTDIKELTNDLAIDQDPMWSPDGQWIAFVSSRRQHWGIYVMDSDGSHVQGVYESGYHRFHDPVWSPDGQKIAFSWEGDFFEPDGIYIQDLRHHQLTKLTTFNAAVPVWSPDGKQIAFVTSQRDGNYEIYVINADGTNLRRLTYNPYFDGLPSWSPDSRQIAFVSAGDRLQSSFDIYVMDADGTNVNQLTHFGNASSPVWRVISQPEQNGSPAGK